jgi:hypothetical protein
MQSDPTLEHRRLVTQIHARVGRNLIRVQSLEVGLKTLVPFLSIGEAMHCLDGLKQRHAQAAKHTLGQLVGSFLEATSSDDPRAKEMVERVLEDRNNLVHHFHSTLGRDSLTLEGCVRVSGHLDAQFEAIKALEGLVSGLLLDVLHALRDITFTGTADYEDFAALCREYSSALRAAGVNTDAIDHQREKD